ncbi:MAG: hypothetical protein PHN31_03095 [Candidatus Gracilibacteria bacterium]|nr:hypothetical protein [Candidatus Gracilibacteria bacterium]
MSKEELVYKDKKVFDNILEKIKVDGFSKLHVLADFDKTLTKAYSKGQIRPSLISVLRSEGYLGEEYSKKAYAEYDYYHKIEIDPNIDFDIKKQEMTNWWTKHLSLLIESGLKKEHLQKVIDSNLIELRDGIKNLLKKFEEFDIPLIIISANGLGTNSIEMYLEKEGFLSKNIKVISNEFFWDDKGNAIGYDDRVIHVFNKDETVLKDYPEIFSLIKDRKNVLLFGDSLGDVGMIEGFSYDNLLKIGFLNEKKEVLFDEYKNAYDLLFLDDVDALELDNLFF